MTDKMFGESCPLPKIPMYKMVQKDWTFLDDYFKPSLFLHEREADSDRIFISLKSKNLFYNGLFLILRSDEGVFIEENLLFKNEMEEQGFKVSFCWNFDEAKIAILSYLEL